MRINQDVVSDDRVIRCLQVNHRSPGAIREGCVVIHEVAVNDIISRMQVAVTTGQEKHKVRMRYNGQAISPGPSHWKNGIS